jgi:hypothetical protein
MRPAEAKKLIAILRGAYPDAQWNKYSQRTYELFLQDLPFEPAEQAVTSLIASRNKWMPKIVEIRDAVFEAHFGIDDPEIILMRIEEARTSEGEGELARKALKFAGGLWEMRRTTNPDAFRRRFAKIYKRLVDNERQENDLRSLSETRRQLGGKATVKELAQGTADG